MSRRIAWIGVVFLGLIALVVGQAANLAFFHAPTLNESGYNPRINQSGLTYARGDILAADGTVLAQSVPSTSSTYPWKRVYPLGALTAGVVGFASPYYGTWALEQEYNSILSAHSQPAQSWSQLINPTQAASKLVTTIQPALQRIAQNALAGRDGAAVVLDPRSGAVLAMYSNPTYDPLGMTDISQTTQAATWKAITTNNGHGFPPLGNVAIQQTFPPGSTMKVVTTAAALLTKPALVQKSYPVVVATHLPTTNNLLYNSGHTPCGGTVVAMLPASCDPGYALLGLDVGADGMSNTATAFGYNQRPPLDLPSVTPAYFPPSSAFHYDLPGLAYSSIGQQNVRATALQNALVAVGIANGGVIMAPHIMSEILNADGSIAKSYHAHGWLHPLSSLQAAELVPLMRGVVTHGTASGVGFLYQNQVAAKTGTAQTGNSHNNTDDWMIAFAPANHPTVAIAVVVPFQSIDYTGALVAGPVVKCLIEGTLAIQAGLAPTGTSSTCPR